MPEFGLSGGDNESAEGNFLCRERGLVTYISSQANLPSQFPYIYIYIYIYMNFHVFI
jgi:hypothetical protein